jgi:hypothetical protein
MRPQRRVIGTTTAALFVVIVAIVGVVGIVTFKSQSNIFSSSSPLTTQSTQASTSCSVSAEGTGLYVTVTSDAGQRIPGAQVSGMRVTVINGETCEQEKVGTFLTNSSGTVLITPNIGSYYLLTIQYQGKSFNTQAPIEPMQSTYVNLKVPSGNVTISEILSGGCHRNANGTACPG